MGTWLPDFQFSQQRTVCPKHQVYRTEAKKPVRASSHILQLLFLLPAGVVGVTSGQCVPFKSKENNAGQKPRSTNTLVECHVETAQVLASRRHCLQTGSICWLSGSGQVIQTLISEGLILEIKIPPT